MISLFSTVVNRSITASFVILAVMMVRALLYRAPRIFSYVLWLVVLLRLVCPKVPQASFGVVPDFSIAETNSLREIAAWKTQTEISGAVAALWLLVAVSVIVYEGACCVSFMQEFAGGEKERRKLGRRTYRVCFTKAAATPFTAGILCPVIYLPGDMEEGARELILEHEKVHIKRLDYLIKPLAFLLCSVHWFNPLVWAAFFLMERDMELSCDEAVLGRVGYERRKEYAGTLLAMAGREEWKIGYPIAFGEKGVKARIKNVVRKKKASVRVCVLASLAACAAGIILLVNRREEGAVRAEAFSVEEKEIPVMQMIPYGVSNEEEIPYGPDDWQERTIANYDPSRDFFEVIPLADESPH